MRRTPYLLYTLYTIDKAATATQENEKKKTRKKNQPIMQFTS